MPTISPSPAGQPLSFVGGAAFEHATTGGLCGSGGGGGCDGVEMTIGKATMQITSDWHIHSTNSYDGHLPMPRLIEQASEKGVTEFGVADHLSTPMQSADIVDARREFLSLGPVEGFHFGVEVSTMSKWELETIARDGVGDRNFGIREGGPEDDEPAITLSTEDAEAYGLEYVIGGVHWPLYVPWEPQAVILSYHRQNMFLATHPLVTIIAHPWWFSGHWADADGRMTGLPWFDDFHGRIPKSMQDELSSALMASGKVVEINLDAIVLNPQYTEHFKKDYFEYMGFLKGRGIKFSIGSDCHLADYRDLDLARAEAFLTEVGIVDDDIWRL